MQGGRAAQAVAACSLNLRNRQLRRAQSAFGLIWGGEWAATVAVGVIAFHHGGAEAVGLVGVARMAPAALVAPFAAGVADRRSRSRVLVGVALARTAALALAAAVTAAGGPVGVVYAALAAATVVQTLFRPTHSALLPTLCRSPAELTGANVARGVLDSASMLLGPLAAAGLLALSGPAAVLITAAGAAAVAAGAIGSLAYDAPPRLDPAGPPIDGLGSGLRAVAREPMLALLTALATLQTFVRGALTVFSVSIALDLLRSGNAEVGILTAALGLGALAGSLSAAALVGHGSLARWFGAGVATWGAPLIVIGLSATRGTVIAMVAVVGVGNALVDVGVFTLLARLADDTVLARVYAAFEGTITFGAAAGSLLAPALIGALGLRGALAAVGAVPPLGVLAAWPALRRLDSRIAVRDEDVTLLRSIPLFRPLPVATIEQLAARATRDRWPAEAWVCRQGEAGEQFFVIENGRAEVFVDGRRVRELGPGDSFGEIALVRNCARTASVRAIAPLTVSVLARAAFVAATMGYAASAEVTRVLIEGHLQRDGAGAGRGGHASVPRPPVPSPPYGPPEQSEPHDGSARRDLPM